MSAESSRVLLALALAAITLQQRRRARTVEFGWSEQHVLFRKRIREVLVRALPPDFEERSRFDPSSSYVSDFSRSFCPILAREGLLIPHWPKEVGGSGLDAFHHWILGEEMFAAGEPRGYQYMSVNWVGPAILKFGTAQQTAQHIPGIVRGKDLWCQGFSEPSAGSDLAALRTSAKRTAAGFVIDGSKIWTSGASLADKCFLLARTSGSGTRGISVFLLSMRTPGIDVRIIKSFNGERSLHEVFFNNVEVPHDSLLGEMDNGWDVVRQVLHNERIGSPRYALTERALAHAVTLLQQRGGYTDGVRARVASTQAAINAARQMCLEVINDRVQGRPASSLTSIARYSLVLADRQLADLLADELLDLLIENRDPLLAAAYRRTGSTGIASGAAEIQLNLIARNVLQLPPEPRVAA